MSKIEAAIEVILQAGIVLAPVWLVYRVVMFFLS